MPPNQIDIDRGAVALKNYVYSIDGWQANFVPWGTYEKGSLLVINKYTDTKDQHACGQLLFDDITAAGYGDRVTLEQCTAGAGAVLAAVGLIQGRAIP